MQTDKNSDHDFVGLHNMAKHIIFLKEASEAALLMAQRLYQHHQELLDKPPQGNSSKSTMQLVHQMLSQKVTQFESWKLRMESMDKRMANVINLVRIPINIHCEVLNLDAHHRSVLQRRHSAR